MTLYTDKEQFKETLSDLIVKLDMMQTKTNRIPPVKWDSVICSVVPLIDNACYNLRDISLEPVRNNINEHSSKIFIINEEDMPLMIVSKVRFINVYKQLFSIKEIIEKLDMPTQYREWLNEAFTALDDLVDGCDK